MFTGQLLMTVNNLVELTGRMKRHAGHQASAEKATSRRGRGGISREYEQLLRRVGSAWWQHSAVPDADGSPHIRFQRGGERHPFVLSHDGFADDIGAERDPFQRDE